MAKFVIGQYVYIKPLAQWGEVRDISEHGCWIGNGRWPEKYLESPTEYHARQAEREVALAANRSTPEELRQARIEYVEQMRENGAWWYGRQGIGWD